jgi:hypothetical protein
LELLLEDVKIRVRWKFLNEIYNYFIYVRKYLKNLPKIQDFSQEELCSMMDRIWQPGKGKSGVLARLVP